YTYDNMSRVTQVTLPDGGTVNNVYLNTGELQKTSGTRLFPVGYAFDGQGRMTYMTNWSSYVGSTGTRITAWLYSTQRGLLAYKKYPDPTTGAGTSPGFTYTYTPAGRLYTRN